MQIFVYIIRSEVDGRDYVGMTQNTKWRLKEHNSGKTKSTKGYRPWKLLYREEYTDRLIARKREKYLKSGYGKMWIKKKWPSSSAG